MSCDRDQAHWSLVATRDQGACGAVHPQQLRMPGARRRHDASRPHVQHRIGLRSADAVQRSQNGGGSTPSARR
jgi:hypothetical protein